MTKFDGTVRISGFITFASTCGIDLAVSGIVSSVKFDNNKKIFIVEASSFVSMIMFTLTDLE